MGTRDNKTFSWHNTQPSESPSMRSVSIVRISRSLSAPEKHRGRQWNQHTDASYFHIFIICGTECMRHTVRAVNPGIRGRLNTLRVRKVRFNRFRYTWTRIASHEYRSRTRIRVRIVCARVSVATANTSKSRTNRRKKKTLLRVL